MSFWQEVLSNVIAFGAVLLLGGVVVLAILWARPDVKHRLLPLQRLRHGEWNGFEVLLCFVIISESGALVRALLVQLGFFEVVYGQSPGVPRESLWIYPLYLFLALALIFFGLFAISKTRPSHLGLSLSRWPHGIVQGVLLFAVVTPVALILFYLSQLVFVVHAHPFETLSRQGLWSVEWALLFFQACVAAPLIEELVFRGVLQGWLRRASIMGHVMVGIWTLVIGSAPLLAALGGEESAPKVEDAWQPLAFSGCLVAWYAWSFYRVWKGILREGPFYLMAPNPPDALDKAELEMEGAEESPEKPLLKIDPERWGVFQQGSIRLAIFGSAMLFAVGHSSAWPSPIPLYLLGLVLGWLAHRTQSLIGPIVLHACFNAVAYGALFYLATFASTNGNEDTEAARPSVGGKMETVVPASQYPRLR